jgi:hypothetical protein
MNPVRQKNPSVATNKGSLASPSAITGNGSRKRVVLLCPFLFRLPVAAEGRLKVTSPISSPKIATGWPTVNHLYPAEFAQRPVVHVSAVCGPVGGWCVAMTQSV